MIETKYGKYFITHDPKSRTHVLGPMIARIDNTTIGGSYFYNVHWVLPDAKMPTYMPLGHPPHIHKDPELLFHIGTNPDDPMDLGAEVEIFMGKELERHVITKSTVVYIPPNFIHCPWRPLKTYRPWIFVEVNQGPRHTEKLYPQVLPKEMREQIDWLKLKEKEEGF